MATLSASGGTGKVTLTGSGFTGSDAVVAVAFSATGRRFLEMRTVPVVAGAVSTDVTVPLAGTVTVKAIDPTNATVLAATGTATVT